MFGKLAIMTVAFFLIPGPQETKNPWIERVAPARQKAEQAGTVEAYLEALDIAWRADDWQAGITLAQAALEKHPGAAELVGSAMRAMWRGGRIREAERLAERVPADTSDRVALTLLCLIHLARGDAARAGAAADRLEAVKPESSADWAALAAVRLEQNRLERLATLVRQAERAADPNNGYPDALIAESYEGLAEFLEKVGHEPFNRIVAYGESALPVLGLVNLPSCEVLINGRGPFRLIVDTGGSIGLSLDEEVAREIGLKSVADATIRGVSGKDRSGQALVDELKLGEIRVRRVLTRIFGVRAAAANLADGILGTGVFASGRLTMDFVQARLIVSPSSEQAGAGESVELRIVGDAKLMALVPLNGESAVALLDTGADACAVAPTRLRALYPDREVRTVGAAGIGVGQGEAAQLSLAPGVDFTLGGRKFQNFGGLGLDVLDTVLSPVLGVQTDLLIGMALFRDMKTATVDFPRCRMWVDWAVTE
jgi:predicted aspartyl protease